MQHETLHNLKKTMNETEALTYLSRQYDEANRAGAHIVRVIRQGKVQEQIITWLS